MAKSLFAPDPDSEQTPNKPKDTKDEQAQSTPDASKDTTSNTDTTQPENSSDSGSGEQAQGSAENKEKEEEMRKKLGDMNDSGGKSTKPTSTKSVEDLKGHKKLWIFTGIALILFFAMLIPYLASGQKKQQQIVNHSENAELQQKAKTNPKIRAALDSANGKNYNAGKETDDKQLSKAQVKDQLDKYNAINARSTLIMLKLHDALANAMNSKGNNVLETYHQQLNDLNEQANANRNVLAEVNKSGSFTKLYNISNKRNNEIIKLIQLENDSKFVNILTAEYNHQAEKSNQENQDFLEAFQDVLNQHNIKYSVDSNGNFSY